MSGPFLTYILNPNPTEGSSPFPPPPPPRSKSPLLSENEQNHAEIAGNQV